VFAKLLLKSICGLKKDEVTGGGRELPNEGLHKLYSSPSIIKEDERGRICSMNGEEEKCI
jgi:hypothetical protein